MYASNETSDKGSLVKVKLTDSRARAVKLGEMKHHVYMMSLLNTRRLTYQVFCAGNIITEMRVLSSTHCFFTNRKRPRKNLRTVKVVAGILRTNDQQNLQDGIQQWRSIKHIYTQKYFRFPAYNLAVVELNAAWVFNQFVNKIPFASKNFNFDGVCKMIAIRSFGSWAKTKQLYVEIYRMLPRSSCETALLRNCRLYYCTAYDKRHEELDSADTEGGGLVCHGTGDPEEVNEAQGILVGITTVINYELPTMHHRIAIFRKWVTDSSMTNLPCFFPLFCCLIIIIFIYMRFVLHECKWE